MARKVLALSIGIGAVAAGVGMFSLVPEQFFPSAERNQFVIDVWMPQGTRIEATDAVMGRIERKLAGSKGVAHYVAFVGQSAPRFYYNVNPQQPDLAYGQFIVNTASVPATVRLVPELRASLATLAPEAIVIVKELQQGSQIEAPVEIRISGDDIEELKRLGEQVREILQGISFSQFVHDDYYNDSYMLDLNVNNELANRLGITDAAVSGMFSGAFDGATVSTFWEGDRAVALKLRLDQRARENFADIGNTYVTSHADARQRTAALLRHHCAGVADQPDRPEKRGADLDRAQFRQAGALRIATPENRRLRSLPPSSSLPATGSNTGGTSSTGTRPFRRCSGRSRSASWPSSWSC